MLHVISREEAYACIMAHIKETEGKKLYAPAWTKAAADIRSPEDLPDRNRSTVDGFAVWAEDTYGCSESIPAMLEFDGKIEMGMLPERAIAPGHCMEIPTGGFLPEGADAVCMLEYAEDAGDEFRYIEKPVRVSENVNRQGDDCHAGDVIVKEGQELTAKEIAILAATGMLDTALLPWADRCGEEESFAKLGIISTGDELVDCSEKPAPGQIRNINSPMVAALAAQAGWYPVCYPIVPDREEELTEAIRRAVKECDAVCISGGSSVGEKDAVYRILAREGEVLFHGLAIKPGKPTMFAVVDGKPIFGLPGHPAAAFFIGKLLMIPALTAGTEEKTVTALLSRKLSSNAGREEIVPVRLEEGEAVPLRAASGVVSVLSKADGYICIGRNTEGLQEGSPVEVYLM